MQNKFLTIITINYNNAPGLQKTIENILSQSFKNFEYIVIDGGSTDDSCNVINPYSERIDYWVSEKDKGIYHALNKGLAKANGEYVLFVNSGDLLADDNTLEEIAPLLTGEEIICGDYKVVSPHSTWLKEYPDTLSFNHFINDSLAHSAAAFTKRDAFKGELQKYDESLKIVSDWKWYLMGIYKYNYSYKHIPKVIGIFDFNGASATNPALIKKEKEQVFNKEFKNIYEELVKSSSYKLKYHTLQSSFVVRLYLTLKKIFSWK